MSKEEGDCDYGLWVREKERVTRRGGDSRPRGMGGTKGGGK